MEMFRMPANGCGVVEKPQSYAGPFASAHRAAEHKHNYNIFHQIE